MRATQPRLAGSGVQRERGTVLHIHHMHFTEQDDAVPPQRRSRCIMLHAVVWAVPPCSGSPSCSVPALAETLGRPPAVQPCLHTELE